MIHTHIHTHIHTYMHACIHTYIYIYIYITMVTMYSFPLDIKHPETLVWHWIRDFWDMWEFYDGIASISIWYTWSTSTYTGSIHQSCVVRPQFSRRYRWDEFLFFMRTCAVAEVIAPSMVPRFSCGPAMEIWAWRRLSLQFMWKRLFFARYSLWNNWLLVYFLSNQTT